MRPGISSFAHDPDGAAQSLVPLLDYAKDQLKHLANQWSTFPVFLKATAGMRELPLSQRQAIMKAIRRFLTDNSTCPFFFASPEMARVISGEEEAAYAWTGVNFVTGALLEGSWGTGTATPHRAFGTVEMGGASAQIAFYQPEQSILADLFKLQVGQSKHWNLYAHSFLHYGHVSARMTIWATLAEDKGCFHVEEDKAEAAQRAYAASGAMPSCVVQDACLARGLTVVPYNDVTGLSELHPPMAYTPMATNVVVEGDGDAVADNGDGAGYETDRTRDQWARCTAQILEPLAFAGEGKRERNKWCNYSHLGQCSFAGNYQPSLPEKDGPYGNFVLIGQFVHLFSMLELNPLGSTLDDLENAGRKVCALDAAALEAKFGPWGDQKHPQRQEAAIELCFLAAYAHGLLAHGHGFERDRKFAAFETMNYEGLELTVGWQLGAILYEINALPYAYDPEYRDNQTTPKKLPSPSSPDSETATETATLPSSSSSSSPEAGGGQGPVVSLGSAALAIVVSALVSAMVTWRLANTKQQAGALGQALGRGAEAPRAAVSATMVEAPPPPRLFWPTPTRRYTYQPIV